MPALTNYLGAFYLSWSAFETTLEIIAKQELGVTDRQAHILFGTLGFSAKMEIAVSLIQDGSRANKKNLIDAIRNVPQVARRNHITHSLIAHAPDYSRFWFVRREISTGLSVKVLDFDGKSMEAHFNALHDAARKVEKLSGISEADCADYLNVAQAIVK